MEGTLIKCLAFLYTGKVGNDYDSCLYSLTNGLFSKYIERAGGKFKEIGVFAALAVFGSLLEFGSSSPKGNPRSLIRRALEDMHRQRLAQQPSEPEATGFRYSFPPLEEITIHEIEESETNITSACKLVFGLFSVALRYPENRNVQPMINCYMALIKTLAGSSSVMQLIEREVPWSLLVSYLNHHSSPATNTSQVTRADFPRPLGDVIGRPLPEDFLMRGQIFVEGYFPTTWFSDADVDDEERVLELPSMSAPRLERILNNAHSIAQHQRWILFDGQTQKFAETQLAKDLPSPDTITGSSIASTEETLILEPLEDEKMLDESDQVESPRSPSKSWTQTYSKPENITTSKAPTILRREQKWGEETTAPNRTASRQASPTKKSPVPFAAAKNNDMAKGAAGYIKIFDDSADPTES